ncbi:hypothetical protein TorRG33x02_307450, partial [Trema orientale]
MAKEWLLEELKEIVINNSFHLRNWLKGSSFVKPFDLRGSQAVSCRSLGGGGAVNSGNSGLGSGVARQFTRLASMHSDRVESFSNLELGIPYICIHAEDIHKKIMTLNRHSKEFMGSSSQSPTDSQDRPFSLHSPGVELPILYNMTSHDLSHGTQSGADKRRRWKAQACPHGKVDGLRNYATINILKKRNNANDADESLGKHRK